MTPRPVGHRYIEAARNRSEPVPSRVSLLAFASSGLLMVLAFPKFNLLPLAAVALLPLLVASAKEPSGRRRFAGGYLAGLIFFAASCYWIYNVQRDYGGLNIPSALGVFAMFCGFLALYWGVFAWLAGYLWPLSWGPVAIPALWVALEYARTYVATGFPWLLTGYALTDYFSIARIARWTGVYGLSYLLLALPVAALWLILRPGRLASVHLAALVALFAGLSFTAAEERFEEDQRAYLVQTNIPQDVALQPWDAASQGPLLTRLRELTLDAAGGQQQPALVVWPEVPAPFYYHQDSFTREYAANLARQTNSYFVMGIVDYVPGSNRGQPTNSLVLLAPSGRLISQYDKMHLVPFGEYVPMRRWLVLAEKLTAEIGDFVPGKEHVVSELPGGRMSGLICYEIIFPNQVRQSVQEGAQVLVNISNDGWYGSSAARYQHLLMARMRAIENARYVLRSTNTGITAIIRPDGEVAAQSEPDRPGVLSGRWAFQQQQTFYSRYGDLFAMASSALALIACAAGWRAGRSQRI